MSEVAQETTKKLQAIAAKLDRKVRQLALLNRRRWYEIGHIAYEVTSKALWKYIRGKKYESEKEYRADIDIGKSTWYRFRRLYQELSPKIETADLKLISAENADHLLRLQAEGLEFDKKLIEKAKSLKEFQFEELVSRLIGKTQAENDGEEDSDERVQLVLKIGMTRAQRDFILETLDEFKAANGLESDQDARALELIFADARDRKKSEFTDMAAAINAAVTELRQAAKLINSGKSADEVIAGMTDRLTTAANLLAWKQKTPPPKERAMAEAVN